MVSNFRFGNTVIKARDIVLVTGLGNRLTVYTENTCIYIDFNSSDEAIIALKSINKAMYDFTILTEDGDIINIAYISVASLRESNGYLFLELDYNEKVNNQSIINHVRLGNINNITEEVKNEILNSIGEISYESFISLYQ